MPLSFERRWSLDRRKDDKKEDKGKDKEKRNKKDKKKFKTKTEEQMAHQIEELNRQLVEERQNTRREKLSVARLQRELAKAKSEGTMKESTMRELTQEREARVALEKQLESALTEHKSCAAQLEALRGDLERLQGTDNAESCVQDVIQNGLSSADAGLSDVERENCNVVVSRKQLDIKVGCSEEGKREKALLLERLKQLEVENSALVLENENQRETYEHCLDEVANQVVQALLMQKDLRDECLKLHGRVRELEHQNRNLRCLFDQDRHKRPIGTPSQSSPHQQYGPRSPYSTSPSLPGRSVPAPSGPYAAFTHPLRNKHGRAEPGPTTTMPESYKDPPLSPRLQQNVAKKKPGLNHSTSETSDHNHDTDQRDGYRRLVRQQYQQYHQAHQQRTLTQEIYRQQSAPANFAPTHSGQHQGRPTRHHSAEQVHSRSLHPYPSDMPGVEGAGEGMGVEDLWALSSPDVFPPMRQRSMPADMGSEPVRDESMNGNLPLSRSMNNSLIAKMQVMGEDRVDRSIPSDIPETRNGYILGDQYNKPFVHAPFHYAQSLLKELQEISASVKSFESLTLEPKSPHQQKRKANDVQPVLQRQKLAKNYSPRASNASSESLGSVTSPKHLLDSTSSITSTESVETALECAPMADACCTSTPRHSYDYQPQWRPEYLSRSNTNSKSCNSTQTSLFPPDTPSPPTTDIEPSDSDYQHYKYLRSRQQVITHTPERDDHVERDSGIQSKNCVVTDSISKSAEKHQDRSLHDGSELSEMSQMHTKACAKLSNVREKDAINQAQKYIRMLGKESQAIREASTTSPIRDRAKLGETTLERLEDVRSKVTGMVTSGQGGNKGTGMVQEAGFDSETDVGLGEQESTAKRMLQHKQLSNTESTQSNHKTSTCFESAVEGSRDGCNKETKISLVPNVTTSELKDPGTVDACSPVWKRKSQLEAVSANGDIVLDLHENTNDDDARHDDTRVASFMTAAGSAGSDGNASPNLSKTGSRTNGEVSPKQYAGMLQGPKPGRKTSLPVPITSTVTATSTSKPSGPSLSKSTGMITETSGGNEGTTKSEPIVVRKLSTDKNAERTTLSLAASVSIKPSVNKPVLSKVKAVVDDSEAKKSVVPQSNGVIEKQLDCGSGLNEEQQNQVMASHVAKQKLTRVIPDGPPPQTVGSREGQPNQMKSNQNGHQNHVVASREATQSLLQRTKMQFNRQDVGRSSLGAKSTQLSKISGTDLTERSPLTRTASVGRGPLAMATNNKRTVDVPALDSSPRLPGRRQGKELMCQPVPVTTAHQQTATRVSGEMVEFTSQSLEEQALVQSMSMESLQSAASLGSSTDWDSIRNSPSKKSPTPLSELLSSDSDSEEESVNFVDMWKARATPPIKLPEWDPSKSIEEHRKKVRESLDRTESVSSTSSEQWILNYPFLDEPQSRLSRSSGGAASRQSSVASISRQDSTNSRKGEDCEDKIILEELLAKERSSQLNSSSDGGSTLKGENRKSGDHEKELRFSAGSSSSLGDSSIMADFVSSIFAEIKLDESQLKDECPSKTGRDKKVKDDLVTKKKPSIRVNRSQSMKVTSRPEKLRTPSDVSAKQSNTHSTNIPHLNVPNNKTHTSAKKVDALRTKPSSEKVKLDSPGSFVNKKSEDTVPRNSFVRRSFMRTSKTLSGSANANQSQSGSLGRTDTGSGKSEGKTKKFNLKSAKGKDKGSDSEAKQKSTDSNPKGKSKIPQLIRHGLKPHSGKLDNSKKKSTQNKETKPKTPSQTAPSDPIDTTNGEKLDRKAESLQAKIVSSFAVDNVPFIDDSSKSPDSDCQKSNQIKSKLTSTLINVNVNSVRKHDDANCRLSPKLSPRLLHRLRPNGVELANSSGSSDNDSVFLPNDTSQSDLKGMSSQSKSVSNGRLDDLKADNFGSELHLDEKEIEDIKNGVLVSETDALSIGSWSAKSSECGLKNSFLFGNGDFGNTTTPSNRSIGKGSITLSISSSPEENTEGRHASPLKAADEEEGEEEDAKKYNVPLVSSDLMEDFEAEELCEEDGMSSDREREAQLTDKERANLLDSLFEGDESDDSEFEGIFDESCESVLDSHPGEREFMKLLGDKGFKRQVVRQSVYCRVSLLQLDIYSLYNRFGDPEKEALASFDFLEDMFVDNAGETHFTADYNLSTGSPLTGGSGGIHECVDSSQQQAEVVDLNSTLKDDFSLDTNKLVHSRSRNNEASSGEFSEPFDTESYGSHHGNKVFDGCYAMGGFGDHLANRSNLCSSMSSSSSSLSSHE